MNVLIYLCHSLLIIIIIHTQLSTSQLQFSTPRYKYVQDKPRPVPEPRKATPWEAVGFDPNRKPFVPYKFFNKHPQKLIDFPDKNTECKSYRHMERGHFINLADSNKVQFRYGWKQFHKNCDIRKFLVCRSSSGVRRCNCMPGMYWENGPGDIMETGTCVSRLGGNCTSVKGFNFRFFRKCGGTTLRCATVARPPGADTAFTRACVCKHANAVPNNDTIPVDRDRFGNLRIQCKHADRPSFQAPRIDKEPCAEYGLEVPADPTNPKVRPWQKAVRTSCGDTPGSGDNIFCKFKDKRDPALSAEIARNDKGICSCLDDKLKFSGRKPKGCFLASDAPCNITAGESKLSLTCNVTKGMVCDKSTNKCVCKEKFIKLPDGFCAELTGIANKLGDNCNDTTPCDEDVGLACNSLNKCVCKGSLKQSGDSCIGLYGAPCGSSKNCFGSSDGVYECIELPELKKTYNARSTLGGRKKDQKYCVCNPQLGKMGFSIGNFFTDKTQRFCTASSPPSFIRPSLGFLLLISSVIVNL